MLTNFILTQLQNPDNRKIVNEGQDIFEVYYDKAYDKEVSFQFEARSFEKTLNRLYTAEAFYAVRKCINLLPCFDLEYAPSWDILSEVRLVEGDYHNSIDLISEAVHKYVPRTIRQALLTCGAMNLEELEKFATDNNLIPTI